MTNNTNHNFQRATAYML